jgi:hypothetical protein
MKFNGIDVQPVGGNHIVPNLGETFLARAGDMVESDYNLGKYVFQTDTYIVLDPKMAYGFKFLGYPMPRYCEEGNGP